MALAYALRHIEANGLAKVTIYGEYLERHPPAHEVKIIENTSWSCGHGIERWRSDCGCNSGREGWKQPWRGPLRGALDWLRDSLIPLYQRELSVYLREQEVAGLDIEHTRELSEEDATTAGVAAVVAQLLDSKQSTVLCTHRPVLPWVFDALALEPAALEPGSIAVIHHRRRRVICVEVHSAPSGR